MTDKIRLSDVFRVQLQLDTDVLRFIVRKLTVGERPTFRDEFAKVMNPPSSAALARQPDEVEKDAEGRCVISAEEIERRRIEELGSSGRAQIAEMKEKEEAFKFECVQNAILRYVRMEPDQVEVETVDGDIEDVTTGEQILRAFAHQENLLGALYGAVFRCNFMEPVRKKVSRWPSDSQTSSAAPGPEPRGATPETTVAPAGPPASADSAAATAETAKQSSGDKVH